VRDNFTPSCSCELVHSFDCFEDVPPILKQTNLSGDSDVARLKKKGRRGRQRGQEQGGRDKRKRKREKLIIKWDKVTRWVEGGEGIEEQR
jgi:hypothetical protein